MTLKTLGMGVVKFLKTKSKKTSDVDLGKIHDKFFDKSGKMKQKGKDIIKKGLEGLK
jgi:hypothetical protein